MASKSFTFLFLLFFLSFPFLLQSQQPYEGLATTDCKNEHNSTSLLGYFCNGQSKSCNTFLIFHSQPSFNTVATISALLGSDPSGLSQANLVSMDATFSTNTKVLVPVSCSCSDAYYQFNTSYLVQTGDTTLSIANNNYQGLSSCQALQKQNLQNFSSFLLSGSYITVPLRCACPTRNQRSNGINYLVSYLVDKGETLFSISQMFGVEIQSIREANELGSSNDIYPLTTLLIPLKNQPKVSQVTAPSPPPPTLFSPPPPSGKSSSHKVLYIVIGVAVVVLVLIASVLAFAFLRSRKEATHIHASDSKTYENSSGVTGDSLLSKDIASIGLSLKVYKYEELALATRNFSDEHRIEGSVYRAVLNGVPSAIKVVNRDVYAEIDILKRINHFNLIQLLGLCFEQGHWYLVCEFAELGPLSNWIFHRSGSIVLNWMQRVQIALDVADGLDYLHSYTELAYVHMDIRSSNILLDANFRAKISNFGHARLAGGKESEFALTKHIVGMRGYTAPEYLEHGLVSVKLDVYAFGVVLTEIVTGREASAVLGGNVTPFEALLRGEDVKENFLGFMDPLLEGGYHMDSALMMVRLAKRCLRKEAGSRPNMGEIAQTLSKIYAMALSGQSPYKSEILSSDSELLV